MLAVALHTVMNEQGRRMSLPDAAEIMGADQQATLRAEKIMNMGRRFAYCGQEPIRLAIDGYLGDVLDERWSTSLFKLAEEGEDDAFASSPRLVFGSLKLLVEEVRKQMRSGSDARCLNPDSIVNFVAMRRKLSRLKSDLISKRMGVSNASARRVRCLLYANLRVRKLAEVLAAELVEFRERKVGRKKEII